MTLAYGYVKAKVVSAPTLKTTRRPHEKQYHLHFGMTVDGDRWDVAVNVGTNDADDQLKYKLVFDFQHPIIASLKAADAGSHDLTGQSALPALDFMRSDLLKSTGAWRSSDIMDGTDAADPAAAVKKLIARAQSEGLDVYVFGRFYTEGDGIHDIHMNQGSSGEFIHRAGNDKNDHNDVWQDGALLVDPGEDQWIAFFSAFDMQHVPTDDLGNPKPGSATI